MQYRKLGSTGYDVSSIGFGTWQIGGERWKKQSTEQSVSLLSASHDLGVNVFDVAVVYGQHKDEQAYLQSRSQELLGKAFSSRRDEVIYVLKLGQFDEYSHRSDYSPARIVEQFQHSLRRLNTSYVDVCLIHAPSIHAIKNERAIGVLQTLQALGHVRAIGYSFEAEPEHVLAAVKQNIDVLMLQLNLIETQCLSAVELARLYGVGVLVGGPLKRGFLSGRYQDIDQLPREDDYWDWNLKLNPMKISDTLAKTKELIAKHGSPANLRRAAFEFILQQEGVASCIVGHREINEVQENISVANQIKLASQSIEEAIKAEIYTNAPEI